MHAATQDGLQDFSQLVNQANSDEETNGILRQELSDSMSFPSCYLFKEYWIELSPCREQQYHPITISAKQRWEALIHPRSQSKTVIALGIYPTRLEAALKAEKMIRKWEKLS